MRHIFGELGLMMVSVALLAVWFVAVTITVPLFSMLGVPQQYTAVGVSVLFFVAFWALGLKALFGGNGADSS